MSEFIVFLENDIYNVKGDEIKFVNEFVKIGENLFRRDKVEKIINNKVDN